MNGNRYFLDTNAVVSLLRGRSLIVEILNDADWVGISVITKLEFLSFPKLNNYDEKLFDSFLQIVEVVDLSENNADLIAMIINLRRAKLLKLPDSIIAASALVSEATLITADKAFGKILQLKVLDI